MGDRVNIGDVARRAGVSRSTVSYVLSGKRPVSGPLRERIQRVINEVGYTPSATAKALAQGRTRTIGLAIPPMRGHLSVDQLHFVGAVAEAAADHDYDILLSPSGRGREPAFERLVAERRVDGFILMEVLLHDQRVPTLVQAGLPLVTIGRSDMDDRHSWVDLDYGGLVAQGVEMLHAMGHRAIAFVNRPQELLDQEYGPAFRAADAFGKRTAELGIHSVHRCCDDSTEAGQACADELLAEAPDVTAVLTINERALVSLVGRIIDKGVAIPERMSLLAVTSTRNASSCAVPISASDVPTAQMGEAAVSAMLAELDDPKTPPSRELFAPPYVDRGSVAPPRQGRATGEGGTNAHRNPPSIRTKQARKQQA
jgi:DNA-binding LacI/PurR family transcriptional regulator